MSAAAQETKQEGGGGNVSEYAHIDFKISAEQKQRSQKPSALLRITKLQTPWGDICDF